MTSFRGLLLVTSFLFVAGSLSSQSYPKDLSWAVAEFQGDAEWGRRLAQMLITGWEAFPPHQVTPSEARVLETAYDRATVLKTQAQITKLVLDREKQSLLKDPAAIPSSADLESEKTLAELLKKGSGDEKPRSAASLPPTSLQPRPIWPPDRKGQPWAAQDRANLALKTSAQYLITGEVRNINGYLLVRMELYSQIEETVLATYETRFSAEEVEERMVEASDRFRDPLLGRAWAGLSLSSPVSGTRVQIEGVWYPLPWASDRLIPGPFTFTFAGPGGPEVSQTLVLEASKRSQKVLDVSLGERQTVVIQTDPPGALLYLDSQFVGASPQTVTRPTQTTRVRAQLPGWEPLAFELGPQSQASMTKALSREVVAPSIPAAKDRFYVSLAAFSFSLTTSAFAGTWVREQVNLANAYAALGDQAGYDQAVSRYQGTSVLYGSSVVLTSGLFVWMMFELGDYLGIAQKSLP